MTWRGLLAHYRIELAICLCVCLAAASLPAQSAPPLSEQKAAERSRPDLSRDLRREKEALRRDREMRPRPETPTAAKPEGAPSSPLRLSVPAVTSPPTPSATDLVSAPNLPAAAALPLMSPLPATKVEDTVTLADLKGRLQATPDPVWLQRHRLFVFELLAAKMAPGGTTSRSAIQ